jgi:hypothetical protein
MVVDGRLNGKLDGGENNANRILVQASFAPPVLVQNSLNLVMIFWVSCFVKDAVGIIPCMRRRIICHQTLGTQEQSSAILEDVLSSLDLWPLFRLSPRELM